MTARGGFRDMKETTMSLFLEKTHDGKYPISPDCAQFFLNFVADMFPHSRGLLTEEEVGRLCEADILMDFNARPDRIAEWSTPERTERARRCFGFTSSWIKDENAAEWEPVKRQAAKMLDEILASAPQRPPDSDRSNPSVKLRCIDCGEISTLSPDRSGAYDGALDAAGCPTFACPTCGGSLTKDD